MDATRWFLLTLCFTMWAPSSSWAQLSFRTKDLKIERSAPCPNSEGNVIQMSNYENVHVSRTVFVMHADLHVTRNITGPLTFQMRVKRCNMDITNCDVYDNMKVSDVCDKLQQKNAMWSQYSNNIHPPLRCPMAKGTYKLRNGRFDFTLASRLPIDGNRWLSYMKVFEDYTDDTVKPPTTKRAQVWCLDSDVGITLSKNPGRSNRKHSTRIGGSTNTTAKALT